MLDAIDISFRFHAKSRWIVRSFSLSVHSGQFVGLKGGSGCGKTTLGKILAGYLLPSAGKIMVDLCKISADKGKAYPVQMLFQHPEIAVNPKWKGRKIISEGFDPDPAMINAFEIDSSWLDRYPAELSSGQLSRLTILRAMIPGTRFIVADEISSMLDAVNQAKIWKIMKRYTEQKNIGVLVISHDSHLLNRLCDSVVEMNDMD